MRIKETKFQALVLRLSLCIFTACRVGRGLLFLRNRKADAFNNDNHKHRYAYDSGRFPAGHVSAKSTVEDLQKASQKLKFPK